MTAEQAGVKAVARRITGFHQDEERDWVAQLECGHNQHVRHKPPWQNRPWVTTADGRRQAIGRTLLCVKCVSGAPPDDRPTSSGQISTY